jgi:hypothetical protein
MEIDECKNMERHAILKIRKEREERTQHLMTTSNKAK